MPNLNHSLIHELENNEALLLMYLAGELPADDRLEVEQMLAADAGLRAELAEIRSDYDSAMGAVAQLDADQSAVPAENHAVRQAMRAMKQWQVDRLARRPVLIITPKRQIPVWAYPLAGAAALLIGTIAWWGFGGQFHSGSNAQTYASAGSDAETTDSAPPLAPLPDSGTPGLPAATTTPQSSSAELTADRLDDSLKHDASAGDLGGNSGENSGDTSGDNFGGGLTDAERQANSLIGRSENASVTSEIFLTEANP